MYRLTFTWPLLAAFGMAMPAHAAFFNNGTGLSNPERSISFDEIPLSQNQAVTTQFAGISFSGTFANPDTSTAYPNITGNRIGNFQSGQPAGQLLIAFDQTLTGAGFSMVTAAGNSTFQAFLDGLVVATATVPTSASDSSDYYGFEALAFNQLSITVDSFDRALLLDNLQITALPEPATGLLWLAGGAIGAVIAARRRSASARDAATGG